jgi:5-formyltetrahydrofolate cyclo-ligase
VDKADWRRWASSQPTASEADSAAVVRHIRRWLEKHPFRTVLTFLAMPGEVDLSDLRSVEGITWLVTRTPAVGQLTVHPLDGPMEQHPFGYMQPATGAPEADLASIELVLVPGVAFDRRGNRLGRGKGYYDGLLPRLSGDVCLLGVTLDWLVVESLPVEEHDVVMNAVVSPGGLVEFRPCG